MTAAVTCARFAPKSEARSSASRVTTTVSEAVLLRATLLPAASLQAVRRPPLPPCWAHPRPLKVTGLLAIVDGARKECLSGGSAFQPQAQRACLGCTGHDTASPTSLGASNLAMQRESVPFAYGDFFQGPVPAEWLWIRTRLHGRHYKSVKQRRDGTMVRYARLIYSQHNRYSFTVQLSPHHKLCAKIGCGIADQLLGLREVPQHFKCPDQRTMVLIACIPATLLGGTPPPSMVLDAQALLAPVCCLYGIFNALSSISTTQRPPRAPEQEAPAAEPKP